MTYGEVLDALGDPTRRIILDRIREQPRAVGQIAEGMDVSRPAVSQHLRVLERVGLVTCSRDGTRRIYRIDPRGFEVLRHWVDESWTEVMVRFRDAVDGAVEGEGGGR